MTTNDSARQSSKQKNPNSQHQPTFQDDTRGIEPPTSRASTLLSLEDGWMANVIDRVALDNVLEGKIKKEIKPRPQSPASSSVPSYASTISSHYEKPKIDPRDRPRTGQLKTIGDPEYVTAENRIPVNISHDGIIPENSTLLAESDIPTIDFGPTFLLKPTSRPSTGGTIVSSPVKDKGSRPPSADRLKDFDSSEPSYSGKPGTPSPLASPINVAWQAASPGSLHNRGVSLTAEQWVQQRAVAASQRQQAPPRKPVAPAKHVRQDSASTLSPLALRQMRAKTPPPFVTRQPSGDWTQDQKMPPSRPHSRNASVHLNSYTRAITPPTTLTAHEQMHIARYTGAPMVAYTTDAQRKDAEQYSPGLFGTLATRETQKAQMGPQGRSNVIVQQALAARHHKHQQQQASQFETDQQNAVRQAQYQMQIQQQQIAQQQLYLAHSRNPSFAGSVPLDQHRPLQQQSSVQSPPGYQHSPVQSPSYYQQPQTFQEAPRPGSAHLQSAGQQYNMPARSPGGTMSRYERQPSIVAQQPGGAQQWQQQQSRP